MAKLSIKEVILALSGLMGKIVGRTKLQKMIYLLERERNVAVDVEFRTYLYGPFSRGINRAMDSLISAHLMESTKIITRMGDPCYEYSLSDEGEKEAMKLLNGLSKDKKEKIIKHVAKFNLMTPTEIVRYVYETYPDAKPKEDPLLI